MSGKNRLFEGAAAVLEGVQLAPHNKRVMHKLKYIIFRQKIIRPFIRFETLWMYDPDKERKAELKEIEDRYARH